MCEITIICSACVKKYISISYLAQLVNIIGINMKNKLFSTVLILLLAILSINGLYTTYAQES